MFARSVGCSCLLFMVYGLILYIVYRISYIWYNQIIDNRYTIVDNHGPNFCVQAPTQTDGAPSMASLPQHGVSAPANLQLWLQAVSLVGGKGISGNLLLTSFFLFVLNSRSDFAMFPRNLCPFPDLIGNWGCVLRNSLPSQGRRGLQLRLQVRMLELCGLWLLSANEAQAASYQLTGTSLHWQAQGLADNSFGPQKNLLMSYYLLPTYNLEFQRSQI